MAEEVVEVCVFREGVGGLVHCGTEGTLWEGKRVGVGGGFNLGVGGLTYMRSGERRLRLDRGLCVG